MKNLIFVPFAFDPKKQTGVNVHKKNPFDIYMKNLCVAIASAARHNPDADVALVSNIDIPDEYAKVIKQNGGIILNAPFDEFVFDDDYTWCLAFYKLCALKKMLGSTDYDNYMYLDADVVVQNSLAPVFEEIQKNVLLYDVNHGLQVRDYRIISGEFASFGADEYATHYGGEFFAANKQNAQKFLAACEEVYKQMQEKNFVTTKGDEFIVSVAASRIKPLIKNASAYIYRFWTSSFYLVTTSHIFNPVCILHLPVEKNGGIVKLYDRYVKKGKFPSQKRLHAICHLPKAPLTTKLRELVNKVLRR